MKEYDFENIVINEFDLYEFEYPDYYVRFDGIKWFVESKNYNLYDEIIMIEDDEMKFKEDETFFESKDILTLEKFNQFKEVVKKDIKDE